MIRIFEMRDLESFEGFVLASDAKRALEIFERCAWIVDGDPDNVMFRELEIQQIDGAANDAVYEALEFDLEGVVTCDGDGGWVFASLDPPKS